MINLKYLERQHRSIDKRLKAAVALELEKAGQHGERYVRQKPDFVRRTGKLQDETTHKVVRSSSGRVFALKMRNPVKYAAPIDKGAKPHRIAARRRKALRFFVGGQLVFRKSVWHPGNRARRFLYRATHSAGGVFHQAMLLQMERIAKTR
jgi:hypothetical protein